MNADDGHGQRDGRARNGQRRKGRHRPDRARGRCRLAPHGEDGQLTLLIIGVTVILFLLVTVVTNASRIFLAQRSLSGAADAAAIAGAGAVDEGAVYQAQVDGSLPLTDASVSAAVADYVRRSGIAAPDRFDRLAVVTAGTTDGVTATVSLRATVSLPFQNLLFDAWADGYPVQVTARARSPLTG